MNVTALVPYQTGAREDWLKQALASLPKGMPYLLLENDGELAEALNTGLKQADTDFVIRVDADDMLQPDCLKHLLDAIWDVEVAYPGYILVDEDLKPLRDVEAAEFCPGRLMIRNYIVGAGTLFRRRAALAVGGYREMEALEDWDLWVRMYLNGDRFKAAPLAKYVYRQVANSRNKFPLSEHASKLAELKLDIVGEEPDLLATFYAQESVPTQYWRCLLPARHLPGSVQRDFPTEHGKNTFTVTADDGKQVQHADIVFPDHRGAAIWQFPGHDYEALCMLQQQQAGFPVLVETDDSYLVTPPYGRQWTRKIKQASGAPLPSIEKHRRIIQWVDGVIVTTDHLAKQYRKFNERVFVCPNQIDPEDWPYRPNFTKEPTWIPWYDQDKTYVGWAASASHLPDSKLVGQALAWAADQPNVEVVLLGLLPRSFHKRFPFRFIPYASDMGAYRALMNIIDIAVCPIVENPWSVCRSDLKPLEHAMAGACTVLSDAEPYKSWEDGVRCRKAKTAKDFLRAVQDLVRNRDQALDLADECLEYVQDERTMAGNIDNWRNALDQAGRPNRSGNKGPRERGRAGGALAKAGHPRGD